MKLLHFFLLFHGCNYEHKNCGIKIYRFPFWPFYGSASINVFISLIIDSTEIISNYESLCFISLAFIQHVLPLTDSDHNRSQVHALLKINVGFLTQIKCCFLGVQNNFRAIRLNSLCLKSLTISQVSSLLYIIQELELFKFSVNMNIKMVR